MYYSLKRAVTWNLSGYLYLILASFISMPLLVRYLGLTQFTQYSLILATTTLVASFNLGLPQAVTRELARNRVFSPARQSLWATSSLIFILTGLLAGTTATVVSYYLKINLLNLPLIFSLGLMGNILSHYQTLPHAEGHFGYYNTRTIIVGTGNTLVAALLAFSGYGITLILAFQLFMHLLSLGVLAYFSLKFFPRPRAGVPSILVAKRLILFGLKNQLGSIVGQIQSQYAKYLLWGIEPLKLSAYLIGTALIQKLVGVVSPLSTSLYPAASSTKKNISSLYLKLQLGLFSLGVLAIIIYQFIGLPLLSWWLGDQSLALEVDHFLRVYRYYGLLLLLTPLSSVVVDASGRPGTTSLFGLFAFLLELGITITLLPSYSHLAPAYGGVISLLIMVPIFLYVTQKILARGETLTPKKLSAKL